MNHPARLALCTWRDVEAYLETSRFILLPIGSTEQHGPNGIIGTDHVTAEAIALGIGDKIAALVAPTINVGMAAHHMAFPGTMTLRAETLIAVIGDCVRSLYAHGFRGFGFVNGHGGNTATGRAAMSGLREELPDAVIKWAHWWEAPGIGSTARELFGNREGQHATPSEVSMTMALYPNEVKTVDGPLDIESCRPRGIPGSVEFRKLYPDGRMGSDPSLATVAHGQRFLQLAIDGLAPKAAEIAAQVAPST